jgi:hypothetical protein
MTPAQVEQVEFIKQKISEGMERRFILVKFQEKFPHTHISAFDRRMHAAKKQMLALQKKIQEASASTIMDKIEQMGADIMDAIERQSLLSKIARGEIIIPVKKPVWNIETKKWETITLNKVPSANERTNAVAELNKMGGDYAPERKPLHGNKLGTDALEDEYIKG